MKSTDFNHISPNLPSSDSGIGSHIDSNLIDPADKRDLILQFAAAPSKKMLARSHSRYDYSLTKDFPQSASNRTTPNLKESQDSLRHTSPDECNFSTAVNNNGPGSQYSSYDSYLKKTEPQIPSHNHLMRDHMSSHHSRSASHHSKTTAHHTASADHHSVSSNNHSASSSRHSVSSSHHSASTSRHSVPTSHQSASGSHHSASMSHHSASGGNHSASGGHHSASGGHHSASGGHHSTYAGHHSASGSHHSSSNSYSASANHHSASANHHTASSRHHSASASRNPETTNYQPKPTSFDSRQTYFSAESTNHPGRSVESYPEKANLHVESASHHSAKSSHLSKAVSNYSGAANHRSGVNHLSQEIPSPHQDLLDHGLLHNKKDLQNTIPISYDKNLTNVPQQHSESFTRPPPEAVPSKSSDEKQPSVTDSSPSCSTDNTAAKSSAQETERERHPLEDFRCVKTSEYHYKIRVQEKPEYGFVLERLPPDSLPSASTSDQYDELSFSTKKASRHREKHKNPEKPSKVQSPLKATSSRGTESNKNIIYRNGNSDSLPKESHHTKAQPSKRPADSNHTVDSATVNGKSTDNKKIRPSTSKDSHLEVKASDPPAVKRPSPSSASNGNKKPVSDKKNTTIDETTMALISSKKERNPVYSGKKSTQSIQSLKSSCIESVRKDILDTKIDGNTALEKLLPVLEQCEPSKLKKIEEQHKSICQHTNNIWEKFCKRDFGDKVENESGGLPWKTVYWRAYEEQQKKLSNIKAHIANGIAKAPPERQTKLVELDCHNPERKAKKMKTEDPVKPEVNGHHSSFHCRSGGSDSSSSPKLNNQKSSRPPPKKPYAPLMLKAKKLVSAVSRRR